MKLMKKINRALIIQTLSQQGPLSRADLTKITDLSPTTISSITEELIQEGLIVEVGEGESKGGRRPILLDINPEDFYILSVNIAVDVMYVYLFNLKFQVINSVHDLNKKKPVSPNLDSQLKELVQKVVENSNIGKKNVVGMGIGATGIINKEKGLITYSASLGISDYPLLDKVKREYDFPILLENDTNLAALGEKKFGCGRQLTNFFYIMIGSAIGGGIIIDNEIYRGKFGGAGEFGHITVEKDGPLCECGNQGCLNAVLTPYITVRSREEFRKSFQEIIKDDNFDSCRYHEFCEYLAMAITNYTKLFDPEAIVLGGEIARIAPERFYIDLEKYIKRMSLKGMNSKIPVLPSSIRTNAVVLGGACLCFDNLYNNV